MEIIKEELKGDDFYSLDAASKKLECSVDALRRKISSGKIKGYKKLGRWYIFHSDLVHFLKSKE